MPDPIRHASGETPKRHTGSIVAGVFFGIGLVTILAAISGPIGAALGLLALLAAAATYAIRTDR